MKSFNIKFAIVSCTLAIAACGTAETDTDTASIEGVEGSAYQQALGADGNVECDSIHEVLSDHGIDPAQLEPDIVFEACLNSGTPEDVCQTVAYTCFGDQGCTEPHPPRPEPVCDELYQLVEQSGIDPTSYDPDFVFEYCIDANYPDEICSQAWDCFPVEPPQPEPMCEEARQLAEELGIDADNASPEELLNLCLDHGYAEDFCWNVIEQCVGDPNDPTDPTDPNEPDPTDPADVDCAEVEQLLADQGYELPLSDEDSQVFYEECVANAQDDALCQMALACVR